MLELRQLRYFVVLARRLNYVRAADELGIAQPTLTRSIQALERQLGVQLFDRDRGGVALTPQGRAIAERAGFLLIEAEDLERDSRLSAGGASGRIRFGMTPMPAYALLQPVLSDCLSTAPAVTNEVVVRDVQALWGMLMVGEIEFFVSAERPLHDLSLARVERLAIFPLSVIVRANHPLLSDAPEEMRFPLLRSSWTGIPIPGDIQKRIIGQPNVIEDFGALASIAATTDAIWLASSYAVQPLLRGSLVEYMRVQQDVEIVLYALKRRTPSPLANSMLAGLRHHLKSLVV